MRTINPEASALLLVDFQAQLMPAIPGGSSVLANASRLLDAAAMLGLPTLFTEQDAEGLGPTLAELLPDRTAAVARKMTFDACRAEGFREMLPTRPDVVVAGCEA